MRGAVASKRLLILGTADPVGRGTPAVSCKNADPIGPQNRHRPHEYALSWRFGLFQAFWVVQPSKTV